MLGEKAACAAFSQHRYMPSYITVPRYPLLWQLHSDCGDFHDGVCHVMKISTAESNPDMRLLPRQTFCSRPDGLATASKMPVLTMIVIQDPGCFGRQFMSLTQRVLITHGFSYQDFRHEVHEGFYAEGFDHSRVFTPR